MTETKIDDGGPAFPVNSPSGTPEYMPMRDGMTLRDAFALAALPALVTVCGNDTREPGQSLEQHIAKFAFDLADAMLAVRKAQGEPQS